jgi:dihydropteroate synthase
MSRDKKNGMLELTGGLKLDLSRPGVVMGILNVTPDSFSDGGRFLDTEKAIARGLQMDGEGAAIIDVGPESSRPGAEAVDSDEQIKRAIPVIKALSQRLKEVAKGRKPPACISIDTHLYKVAEKAVNSGAAIINDITAGEDERMIKLAAERDCAMVLMHMQGRPENMQEQPTYNSVVDEVLEFLLSRAKRAESMGLASEKIFIDPGIGFGKTTEHNLELLRNLERFTKTEYKVLLGASRKRFTGVLTGAAEPEKRVFATAATTARAVAAGVDVVRVHDIRPACDVVNVAREIF